MTKDIFGQFLRVFRCRQNRRRAPFPDQKQHEESNEWTKKADWQASARGAALLNSSLVRRVLILLLGDFSGLGTVERHVIAVGPFLEAHVTIVAIDIPGVIGLAARIVVHLVLAATGR